MLLKMRSKMQNEKGFTLVELMVVVVILGILVAIAVPVYNSVTEKANRNAVEANLRTIDGAISTYGAIHDGAVATKDNLYSTTTGAVNLLQEWPAGPDDVTYSVVNGRAVVTKGTNTGTWFNPSTTAVSGGFSLPITWP